MYLPDYVGQYVYQWWIWVLEGLVALSNGIVRTGICFFLLSCYSTYAMSGALAWQVKNLNKSIIFVFLGEMVRGVNFYLPRLSSLWCVLRSSLYLLSPFVLLHAVHTISTTFTQRLCKSGNYYAESWNDARNDCSYETKWQWYIGTHRRCYLNVDLYFSGLLW